MNLGIEGKKALVTGASKGLGLASALALAREGCEVAIVSRSFQNLEKARQLFPIPGNVRLVAADLSTREGIEHCAAAVASWGVPDILVNNTGGPPAGKSFDLDDAAWQKANESLLLFVKRMCERFVPAMRQRKWGRVVTIASFTAREPAEQLVLSNTYRAGVIAYLKGLAREVAADGVTVNAVLPGAYLTERYEQLLNHKAQSTGKTRAEVERETLAQLPQGRFQRPEELGAVVAFLASEQASAVTGAAIPVEGGMLRGIW
jgi:3-oxoacyl-[acyl-carrier protein] reductase